MIKEKPLLVNLLLLVEVNTVRRRCAEMLCWRLPALLGGVFAGERQLRLVYQMVDCLVTGPVDALASFNGGAQGEFDTQGKCSL